MKEPVDHILRPRLPWRSPDEAPITECGYDASKVKTLTREEYAQRRADLGRQRTALLTCMTCSDTCERWAAWDVDPRSAIVREAAWENVNHYYYRAPTFDPERGARLFDELNAIVQLIAAHRDEFAELFAEQTKRREWIAAKAARQKGKVHR